MKRRNRFSPFQSALLQFQPLVSFVSKFLDDRKNHFRVVLILSYRLLSWLPRVSSQVPIVSSWATIELLIISRRKRRLPNQSRFIHGPTNMKSFKVLYLIAQIVGIAVVATTFAWVLIFMGVVWDVTNKEIYNWHSICMVLGMIFFYGNCESSLVKLFCGF